MKKRILFLISDTGGGHRTAAQAIAEAIHYLYPDQYDTIIEDVWKNHTLWPINKLPNTYAWLTGAGRPIWKMIWYGSAYFRIHNIIFPLVEIISTRTLSRYFDSIRPDIVISVHPLLNHLGLKLLNHARLDIPFVTVVTDMVSVHPTWICPRVTRCLVPTGQARLTAIAFGMPPAKVKVYGLPVGLKFTAISGGKSAGRRKLGLDVERHTVLIIGGGEGDGRVFDIARALAQAVSQAQLLIVAGRNKRLQDKLEAVAWEIPTRIHGFVDNMPELMGTADILLTKAGPGTLSEAFIAGLPILLYGYIPGQEWGNVTYVQQHQAGAYAETPPEITGLVLQWLDPNSRALFRQMAGNAARLARPSASLAIAVEVCSLV